MFATREQYEKAWAALTEDERLLWLRYDAGKEWAAIAAELGGTADGRRKQFEPRLQAACKRLASSKREVGDE